VPLISRSIEFDAPLIKIRGVLSRPIDQIVVNWKPGFRTFKQNIPRKSPGDHHDQMALEPPADTRAFVPLSNLTAAKPKNFAQMMGNVGNFGPNDGPNNKSKFSAMANIFPANGGGGLETTAKAPPFPIVAQEAPYVVELRGLRDNVLASGDALFSTPEGPSGRLVFALRLPFQPDAQNVVLMRGKREIGRSEVVTDVPDFELLQPLKSEDLVPNSVVTIRWRSHERRKLTYAVRFCADGKWGFRLGVGLEAEELAVDLGKLPGGNCTIQVIATNGYQTSYVELPDFVLPYATDDICFSSEEGPIVSAEGISDRYGVIRGQSVQWLANGTAVFCGTRFDVRSLGGGVFRIKVSVSFPGGSVVSRDLGEYDGRSGKKRSNPMFGGIQAAGPPEESPIRSVQRRSVKGAAPWNDMHVVEDSVSSPNAPDGGRSQTAVEFSPSRAHSLFEERNPAGRQAANQSAKRPSEVLNSSDPRSQHDLSPVRAGDLFVAGQKQAATPGKVAVEKDFSPKKPA
jgi:hypothetical protein